MSRGVASRSAGVNLPRRVTLRDTRILRARARRLGVPARPRLAPHDLPGAVALFPYPYPHELGNILLHEFLHNRLFALEEEGRFFNTGDAGGGAGAVRADRVQLAELGVPRRPERRRRLAGVRVYARTWAGEYDWA